MAPGKYARTPLSRRARGGRLPEYSRSIMPANTARSASNRRRFASPRGGYPDVVAVLGRCSAHEKRHCAAFFAAMPERRSRPCRIMALWSNGG